MVKCSVLTIDSEKNEAKLNGKAKEMDIEKFTSKLLTIVSSWEEKMINPFVLDGLEYSVEIEKDGKNYKYEGKNSFPDNFEEFAALIKSENIW